MKCFSFAQTLFLRLFRLRHESLLFNEHSVVGDLETTRWREMFLLFNRKIFNRLGKMTKHFTHRTRVEGRTDRQNDAAEWPPFFATSTLQIFLPRRPARRASSARYRLQKTRCLKSEKRENVGRRTRFKNCQDKSYFLNPEPWAD